MTGNKKMKRKVLFMLAAAFLLVPWTVAYAYDGAAASTVPVTISSPGTDSLPRFQVYGNAIGSVTSGDIFLVDSSGSTTDTHFTLCITNTDELVHNFRYMTLNIGIYVQDGTGEWRKMSATEGDNFDEIYLSMQNGAASFALTGGSTYKITVEKGCFYSYNTGDAEKSALPHFHLTAS
jgi:hypothetical protein